MINNQNLAVLSEKVAHLESAVSKSTEASGISYDNTDSGLTAENAQAAIDEVNSKVTSLLHTITPTITTTASGGITLPDGVTYTKVLNIVCMSRVNVMIFLRGGDNVAFAYDVVNGVLTPLATTEITISITYYI